MIPSSSRPSSAKRLGVLLALLLVSFVSASFGQTPFATSHSDNGRTASNTNETILTPANVNANSFGRLFNYSIEYQALAQPLYVPNVAVQGLGIHNVVYVATMADSVYAFDADSNQGANASPLWYVNFTNPAAGITTASVATKTLPCASTESSGPGFTQEGIVSTPVIDLGTGTMYVVAKTLESGTVRHRLHALDITSGAEKFGGPVLITATSVSNKGHKTTFNSLHQKNRPGLLLLNGILYIGFGSNFCNDHNTGWVLSYDPTSLLQQGAFNTSPDNGLASVWQTGNGLAADEQGYVYGSTAEASTYDVPSGGQTFCNSILKLSPTSVSLADYFTPYNVAFLNSHDQDVSSIGPIVLPDQSGPYPHELVASGKYGTVYVLNRDNMGMFVPNDTQIIQEFSLIVGGENMASPAYWNQTVYFAPDGAPVQAYQVSNGLLSLVAKTAQLYIGSHSPSVSANGTTNGVLWVQSGTTLYAFDAVSLNLLYSTDQNKSRDALPKQAHFSTQTVADGRVYVATRTTLEVYGLQNILNPISGGGQTAQVVTTLPNPIVFQAVSPYGGTAVSGVSVSFSDGSKGGTFNPATALTGPDGSVQTSYTLPKTSGTYTITASGPGFASVAVTETATPGPAAKLYLRNGNNQTAPAGTTLPQQLIATVQDIYYNGVPGITVNFTDRKAGGSFNPTSTVSDSNGWVRTSYTLPTKPGKYHPTVNSSGLTSISFTAYAVVGPAASVTITGGNNQTGTAGTQLPQALTVVVTDQFSNPVSGVAVTFSDGGAGGSFSNPNPVTTGSDGSASQLYTLPPSPGLVTVNATATGVASPATFSETAK